MKTLDFQNEEAPSLQVNFKDGSEVVLVLKDPPASERGDFEQKRQDLIDSYGKEKEALKKRDDIDAKKAKEEKKIYKSTFTKDEANVSVKFLLELLAFHVENLDKEKFGKLGWHQLNQVKEGILDLFKKEEEADEKKSE